MNNPILLPNSSKTVNAAKCQSIYMNLLALREHDKKLAALHWLREFEQTARCDGESSFKNERQEYRDHIGEDTVKRVLEYRVKEEADYERVEQAVIHYFDWHQRRLVSALTWPNYFKYQLFDKHERLLAWLGLAAPFAGGWVFVRHRLQKLGAQTIERAKNLNEVSKTKLPGNGSS